MRKQKVDHTRSKSMFLQSNDDKFKKIIDEFILSSSDNESIKNILRNIDFEALQVGISFYQMIFTLSKKMLFRTENLYKINDKI
jgi:hypothetical protein